MKRTPHVAWWIAIPVGITATGCLGFLPFLADDLAIVPGVVDQDLVQRVFLAAVISHVIQAAAAWYLAGRLGEPRGRWAFQTLALGIPSTRLLFSAARRRGAGWISAASFLLPLASLILSRYM